MSDLHLEFAPFTAPATDADVIILAGDTQPKLAGVRWALKAFPDKPVLYVMGNHEFYGEKWPRLIQKARELCQSTNVSVLENDSVEIAGWRFFGATLWTDYALLDDPVKGAQIAVEKMWDHKVIRHYPSYRKFTPMHAKQAHSESLIALRAFLTNGPSNKSVVITHHAPSLESVAVRDRDNPITAAYASNLENLINQFQPVMWIHGHLHRPNEYRIGNTRIVANPRGYPGELVFAPATVVTLPAHPAGHGHLAG